MPDELSRPNARVIICNRVGDVRAEISCRAERSWVLNGIGVARLTISKTDPLATERNLRFGNRILIKSDTAGDWGGIIWTPRKWTSTYIEVTAYTAEYILKLRRTESETWASNTASGHFAKLIDIANAPEQTGIVFESGYAGGAWSETVNYETGWDVLQRIALLSAEEWSLTPSFTNGSLKFIGRWHLYQGTTQSRRLYEGTNLELPSGVLLTEQSDIGNDVLVVSQGSTQATTFTATAQDAASRAKYGLAQLVSTTQAGSSGATQVAANALLSYSKNPRRTFAVTALNAADTFLSLRIGNFLYMQLVNYGYLADGTMGTNTLVRVIARQYDEMTGKMGLTLQEIV